MPKIEEMKSKMESDPIEFMNNKEQMIQLLIEQISLDITVLESNGINLKSELHNNVLTALMNIYLTCLPQPKMDGEEVVAAYEPNDKDKKREELKHKLEFVAVQNSVVDEIKKADCELRVRFCKVPPPK
jgi:hypothetical protein